MNPTTTETLVETFGDLRPGTLPGPDGGAADQRRHERMDFARPLRVREPLEPAVWVRGRDVSEGGLGFVTDRPFALGTVLQLGLPGGPFTIDAVVRSVRPRGDDFLVGVERC